MVRFNVGDFVFLKSDKVERRLYRVLAVSYVYDSVKLGFDSGRFVMWRGFCDVRKAVIYQPELVRIGG